DKLRYILRDSDVIGRFGGDEFIVIIDTSDGNINPEEVADKIKATITQPVAVNGISAEIGVSIGIAIYPDTASDVDSLLSFADREMYKHKQQKIDPVATSSR
ncbi:MAG: PAS domain S-box protein, partial [Gammaproteobacteria bacterium]